jgi:ABC-type Fe3+ transport system permease subunit
VFLALVQEEELMNMDQLYAQYASDLIKQTITLATFVLGVSVTFWKDALPAASHGSGSARRRAVLWQWLLPAAWVLLFLALVFGLLALMALVGDVFEARETRELTIEDPVQYLYAAMQIAFGTGMLSIVAFGTIVFVRKQRSVAVAEPP